MSTEANTALLEIASELITQYEGTSVAEQLEFYIKHNELDGIREVINEVIALEAQDAETKIGEVA